MLSFQQRVLYASNILNVIKNSDIDWNAIMWQKLLMFLFLDQAYINILAYHWKLHIIFLLGIEVCNVLYEVLNLYHVICFLRLKLYWHYLGHINLRCLVTSRKPTLECAQPYLSIHMSAKSCKGLTQLCSCSHNWSIKNLVFGD